LSQSNSLSSGRRNRGLIPDFEEPLHGGDRDEHEHQNHRPKKHRIEQQTNAQQDDPLGSFH
jgi:hypothetical protein